MRQHHDSNPWAPRSLALAFSLFLGIGCSTDTTEDASDHARIFATASGSSELTVIDDASHRVLKTLPLDGGPAIILKTPDDKQLFTANWGAKSVSAIDASSYAITTLPMGGRPYVIAMSPDGQHVYAGVDSINAIVVISTQTHTIERTMPQSALPASIIVSPDGKTLYVAMLGSFGIGAGSLIAVDATTGSVTKQAVTVGGAPGWITISKDGSKVYTLNASTDDITVVDTASWSVLTSIKTGTGSESIIGNVTPDGTRLYVTNHGLSNVIGIDIATNAIVQTINLDGRPVGVSFNEDGTQIYTTDFGTASETDSSVDSLRYLATGVYNGTGPGQVRAFDLATGNPVGVTVATGPGATSVVHVPAAK